MADRGYESEEDMVKCLEDRIIPHVITDDGENGYELETAYEESEVNAESTDQEELKKALHAGVIPVPVESRIFLFYDLHGNVFCF